MDDLIQSCRVAFDAIPQPCGIAQIYVNDAGQPIDFGYEYVNAPLAALTGATVEELTGKRSTDLWVGLQKQWVDPFFRAAHKGDTVEFEAVSMEAGGFLHVLTFPLAPGYCGFTIQDVTDWVDRAYFSVENTSQGLFFYDATSGQMVLSPSAFDFSGMADPFVSMRDFAVDLLGVESADELGEKLASFEEGAGTLVHEGRLADGRWMRISLTHTPDVDRFTMGLLEDVTREKELEEASAYHLGIIDSLARENFALYLVDLEADTMDPYRIEQKLPGPLAELNEGTAAFSDFVNLYTESYMSAADRDRLRIDIGRASLVDRLRQGGEFSVSLRRAYGSDEEYVELRFIPLKADSRKVVLAARNVTREVREQLRQKTALQDALDLAEHASEAKSTFLTNMSHDFRTPLNSITGFASIALRSLDDQARVRDCMNKIMLSSNHLLSLVDDILDVSRVESGKMPINEEPVDLRELLNSIQTMFSTQALVGRIDFRVIDEGLAHPYVMADRLRLNQILVNIIGNAFKFTEADGVIALLLSESPHRAKDYGSYTFTVADTGCGMTPEFTTKLFEPFERDGLGRPNTTEGTGLGMTITKNLVDPMGGTIEVRSRLGEGTSITVTLSLRGQKDQVPVVSTGKGQPSYGEVSFAGRRVLVVDDDALSREIMMELLREHGFTVEEADDGDAAVERMGGVPEGHYDAIIMDMRMRKMDGDEATRCIRALPREDVADLPIIAVTADAFDEARRRSHEAGMTAHTTKPLNVPELLGILVEHLPAA